MYIAQWRLNSTDCRNLGVHDNYDIHQAVCEIFDQSDRDVADRSSVKFDATFAYNMLTILIQSETPVVNPPLVGQFNWKEIDLLKHVAGKYRIMVKLNAVKQVKREGKSNNKRIPVVGESNIIKWLYDRQYKWGISIENATVGPTNRMICNKHRGNHSIVADWHSVDMICTIVDAPKFHAMIMNGIGKNRSLGCSMVKFFKISN